MDWRPPNMRENMRTIRKGLTLKKAIEMYKSLIRPHMKYGVAAWAAMKESDAKRLRGDAI